MIKTLAIVFSGGMLMACQSTPNAQAIWSMNHDGIYYQGNLLDMGSAHALSCQQCEVTTQTLLTPFGPSHYVLLKQNGQFKAIWGSTAQAELFIPNNHTQTRLPLTRVESHWQLTIDGAVYTMIDTQLATLTIGDAQFNVLVKSEQKSQRFIYSALLISKK